MVNKILNQLANGAFNVEIVTKDGKKYNLITSEELSLEEINSFKSITAKELIDILTSTGKFKKYKISEIEEK